MRISIWFSFLLWLVHLSANGQFIEEIAKPEKKQAWTDRVFIGGNLGLAVGAVTQIEISPLVGYRLTDRFSSGIGLTYQYHKEEIQYPVSGGGYEQFLFKTSVYGGKVFSTFALIPDMAEWIPIQLGSLVLQAENEVLNVGSYTKSPTGGYYFYSDGERRWINNLLIGGGLSQPVGPRARINLLVLWNLTETAYSPYTNPVIRIGFNL